MNRCIYGCIVIILLIGICRSEAERCKTEHVGAPINAPSVHEEPCPIGRGESAEHRKIREVEKIGTASLCRMSDNDGIIIVERIVRLIANMYIAYLNPLWALLAALGTVISYGIHFAYESYVQGRPREVYDLPWCILSAWSLVMDWMVIAAYVVVQTSSQIGSEFLGIIVGCVLVSLGVHVMPKAFTGDNSVLRNVAIVVWLFIYFPWIYWPYVSLFEPYGYGPYRPLLPHQRLMFYFMNFMNNFWYSLGTGFGLSPSFGGVYGSSHYGYGAGYSGVGGLGAGYSRVGGLGTGAQYMQVNTPYGPTTCTCSPPGASTPLPPPLY